MQTYEELDESYKRKIKVLSGHVGYGIHQYLPQPAVYFTAVRHPVDRVVSTYYFVRENTDHYMHQAALSMSLEEFAGNTQFANADNDQTRFLSGYEIVGTMPQDKRIGWEWLEKARQNIENHFILLGITDQLNTFISMLGYLLETPIESYPRENVGKTRPALHEIPLSARDTILHYNQLDLALYELAQEKFQETYKQFLVMREHS